MIFKFSQFIRESRSELISQAMDIFKDFEDEFNPYFVESSEYENSSIDEEIHNVRSTLLKMDEGEFDWENTTAIRYAWTKSEKATSDGSYTIIGVELVTNSSSFIDDKKTWMESRKALNFLKRNILPRIKSLGLFPTLRGVEYDKGSFGSPSTGCLLMLAVCETKDLCDRFKNEVLWWDHDNINFIGREKKADYYS